MKQPRRHPLAPVSFFRVAATAWALLVTTGCGPADDGRARLSPSVPDPGSGMGTGGSTSDCPPGQLWCPCNAGTCEGELACSSDVCVLLPGDEGESSGGSSGPAGGSSGGGTPDDPRSTTDSGGETGETIEADVCANAASGAGHYCGDTLGGDSSALYLCSADGETLQWWSGDECPNGCTSCEPGTADYCPGGITPVGACVQLSCGQIADAAGWEQPQCEVNGNGACGGSGPETFDCDHCCDL